MCRSYSKLIPLMWISIFVLFFGTIGSGQDSAGKTRQTVTPSDQKQSSMERYISRTALIDSLSNELIFSLHLQDSLRKVINDQKEQLTDAEVTRLNLEEESKQIKKALDGANGANLQSSHTKSILFIFNVIVGLFLLIAMIWMFARRRSETPRNNPVSNFPSNTHEGYDHKLERIEKLGNLRDKGLLTEDEFNLQKKQILGDRG